MIPDRPRWARIRWLWLYAALAPIAAVACLVHDWPVAYLLLLASAGAALTWGLHR